MESYIQLTLLNNYLSNCVIKLHMKLFTPNLPLNNCVIKLHIKLQNQLCFLFFRQVGWGCPKNNFSDDSVGPTLFFWQGGWGCPNFMEVDKKYSV